jgi:hypothetical protein
MEYNDLWATNATILISEQLPEDGQVGPKHVAIDVILM